MVTWSGPVLPSATAYWILPLELCTSRSSNNRDIVIGRTVSLEGADVEGTTDGCLPQSGGLEERFHRCRQGKKSTKPSKGLQLGDLPEHDPRDRWREARVVKSFCLEGGHNPRLCQCHASRKVELKSPGSMNSVGCQGPHGTRRVTGHSS